MPERGNPTPDQFKRLLSEARPEDWLVVNTGGPEPELIAITESEDAARAFANLRNAIVIQAVPRKEFPCKPNWTVRILARQFYARRFFSAAFSP
jgi:hypothetical protein